MYKPHVYTASKIRHGDLWRIWATRLPEIEFTARWVGFGAVADHSVVGVWTEEQKTRHWIQDIQDVQRSDYLLAYMVEGDTNRGTYVEIGAAISLGKIILTVGFDESHDSWLFHPLVRRFPTPLSAFEFILERPL